MKDGIGQEIQVGDYLFYGQSVARNQYYGVLKVLSFSPTRAKVKWVKVDRSYVQPGGEFWLKASHHCVVITQIYKEHEE